MTRLLVLFKLYEPKVILRRCQHISHPCWTNKDATIWETRFLETELIREITRIVNWWESDPGPSSHKLVYVAGDHLRVGNGLRGAFGDAGRTYSPPDM